MKGRKDGPVANHFIIETSRYIYMQSYKSLIIRRHKRSGTIVLDKSKWNYSNVTSKYRNLFLSESTKEINEKIKSGVYKLRSLNA